MFPHKKLDWLIGRLETDLHGKPEDPALRLEYCRALLSKGLFHGGGEQWCAKALRQSQHILKDDTFNAEALVLAGTALVGMNRIEGARSYLDEAMALAPERADLYLALGALYRAESKRHRAITYLEQACRQAPDSWEPHLYLGRTLMEHAAIIGHPSRLLERAQYHLVSALKGGVGLDLQAPLVRDLGRACLLTGRYVEAEKLFLRLREHPRYRHRARQHLGQVAYSLGKYKNAINYLRTYLADNPHDANAQTTVAMSYLQLGEIARAREACNKALLLDPKNVQARYTLGCAVLEEGDPREALRIFRVTIKEHPTFLPAYLEMARTRRAAGDARWLSQALQAEVGDYDKLPPRTDTADPRACTRERVAVLLEELRAVGPSSVGAIVSSIRRTHDEALRFQLFEAAITLAAGLAADDVALKLRDPGRYFSRELGRQAFMTALSLPEPVLTRGLAVGEEDLKREALRRYGPASDVVTHNANVDRARIDARSYQALLLLATARRRSRTGRQLLERWVETADDQMATVARVALAAYGDSEAVEDIRLLAGARGVASRVDRILQDLLPPSERLNPTTADHDQPAHCMACGRAASEVEHLMAGGKAIVCDQCVLRIGRERGRLAARDDSSCHLCGRTAFESRVYSYNGVDICDHCLELSLGLLEREEVDQFLAAW